MTSKRLTQPSKHVTEARAAAQRAKLDAQAEARKTADQEQTSQTPPRNQA